MESLVQVSMIVTSLAVISLISSVVFVKAKTYNK